MLPVFWELLLRNGNISSKFLFWYKRTQHAGTKWQQKSYFTSTSITLALYIFKLVLYFNSIIISNKLKYCLAINRGNFLQDTVWFLQACFADLLSAMMACYWKSMYQEPKEINAWDVTVWSIMVKCYYLKWLM